MRERKREKERERKRKKEKEKESKRVREQESKRARKRLSLTLSSTIQKLIAVYYKNNLLITYEFGLFRPEFCNALLNYIFRPLISPYFWALGYISHFEEMAG